MKNQQQQKAGLGNIDSSVTVCVNSPTRRSIRAKSDSLSLPPQLKKAIHVERVGREYPPNQPTGLCSPGHWSCVWLTCISESNLCFAGYATTSANTVSK